MSQNATKEMPTTERTPFWQFSPMLEKGRTWESDGRRIEVLTLWRRGLVPLAIADVLGVTVETVAGYLRELVSAGAIAGVPSFLSLSFEDGDVSEEARESARRMT